MSIIEAMIEQLEMWKQQVPYNNELCTLLDQFINGLESYRNGEDPE